MTCTPGEYWLSTEPCQLAQLTSIAMAKDRLTCLRTVRSLSNPQDLCQSDPFQGSHHATQVPTEALRPSFVFSSFSVLALYFPYPLPYPLPYPPPEYLAHVLDYMRTAQSFPSFISRSAINHLSEYQ